MPAPNYVVSLDLSSHAWLPATEAGKVRPLCGNHVPRLLAHSQRQGELTTVYRCMVCGACYEIVEVPA